MDIKTKKELDAYLKGKQEEQEKRRKEAEEKLRQAREQHAKNAEVNHEKIEKEANAFNLEYAKLNDEQKNDVLDKVASSVNENDKEQVRALIEASTNVSEIVGTLETYILNQYVRTTIFTYPEVMLISNNLNTPVFEPTGKFQVFWKDYKQFESSLNSEDGGVTTARNAYDDVVISDYNANLYDIFTQTYEVDFKRSYKYKIINSALNDFAKNPGIYVAVINDLVQYVTNATNLWYRQYVINCIDSGKLTFDKTYTYTETPTTINDSITEVSNRFIEELNILMAETSYPSRTHLGDAKIPDGATRQLEYTSQNKEFYLLVNPSFWKKMRVENLSAVFNTDYKNIPANITVVMLQFTRWAEDYTWTSTTLDPSLMLAMLVQKDAIRVFQHYEITKAIDTPKAHYITNSYLRLGSYQDIQSMAAIWLMTADAPAGKTVAKPETKQVAK